MQRQLSKITGRTWARRCHAGAHCCARGGANVSGGASASGGRVTESAGGGGAAGRAWPSASAGGCTPACVAGCCSQDVEFSTRMLFILTCGCSSQENVMKNAAIVHKADC